MERLQPTQSPVSSFSLHPSSLPPLPLPSLNITIRPGVLSDVPFMDSLQKLHREQVGWMPTSALQGKINAGHVLIAEATKDEGGRMKDELNSSSSSFIPHPSSLSVGYCIGNDQYFKRDDVGIIYQLNVAPGKQRGFIGASLLKAQFERSAYGCKLYCCWCAQDIEANKFWEAMGFVPLAFRAGSEKKSRVHIFWQKRIRADDTTTPWWFPSKTAGGSIREDRIVLPIPPGAHWSDAKPLILPSGENPKLEARSTKQIQNPKSKIQNGKKPVEKPNAIRRNGLSFDIPMQGEPVTDEKPRKETKARRVKPKNDPRLVAAARELRDRWLEQVNSTPLLAEGKYEVCRRIGENVSVRETGAKQIQAQPKMLLPADFGELSRVA